MQGLEFIIRLVLASVVFYFTVVVWALAPFLNPAVEMDVYIVSVFLGNQLPTGAVRDLLLLSRGLLGLMVTLYIFIPGLSFFFEFETDKYNNTIAILVSAACIAVFFVALVVHYFYYI